MGKLGSAESTRQTARCPAAGSLTIALNRAVKILSLEFRIPEGRVTVAGTDCSALEASWKVACSSMLECMARKDRRKCRLTLALKSCKRLFDAPCVPCDKKAAKKAKSAWASHVGRDVPRVDEDRCRSHVALLRERVRELVCGWGRKLDLRRALGGEPYLGEYIPDQQGCYEVTSRDGGTLACSEQEYSGDRGLVRRGVAKTKGKHRVVTMQSAEVKRVLTPVHNALYDHISSFGWCVRGDVTKGDFDAVLGDLREGEDIISGDYQSATDNIYLPAVEVIVDELSRCPELTELEREILLESFSSLRWEAVTGSRHPIKRGSMMGNLVSFPLLCLLNKACFDIACDVSEGRRNVRVGRFNGDDCVFGGDARFFGIWRHVTGVFGLVVNEEKTGRSRRWAELNSSIYDVRSRRFVAKPVLSFLRPSRYAPGNILPDVLRGISSFSWSIQQWIVKDLMRYEISLRGVSAGLSEIGPRWMSELLRLRWFRAAALSGGPPTREVGVCRDLAVEQGPPPDSRAFSFVTKVASRLARERVERWRGVRVIPHEVSIDRKAFSVMKRFHSPRLSSLFSRGEWRWRFCWPKELLALVRSEFPWVLRPSATARWTDDHPFLTRRRVFFETPRSSPWRDPAFASTFCSDWPLGYQ
jgi:hypothetical protein